MRLGFSLHNTDWQSSHQMTLASAKLYHGTFAESEPDLLTLL